jgi:DNA-binding transcriptional LysR family regulator
MGDAEQRDIAAGELIDLELIRRFIVVADELNFTRAAARLGLSQPPLSAAIGKLERKLTVAVKPGTAIELLTTIMQRCAQNPAVPEVHILFGHPGRPAAAVRQGAADVAILRAPFGRRGLDTELLLTEPRVAVLPAHHRLAGRAVLRCADLAAEPIPRWKGQADPGAAAHWTGDDQDAERPPGPEINDISQLLDAVALGNAVAYVPASLAQQHHPAGLVFVPVSDLSPSEVVVAWPDASRSRAVADFVRAAVEAAGPAPRVVA